MPIKQMLFQWLIPTLAYVFPHITKADYPWYWKVAIIFLGLISIYLTSSLAFSLLIARRFYLLQYILNCLALSLEKGTGYKFGIRLFEVTQKPNRSVPLELLFRKRLIEIACANAFSTGIVYTAYKGIPGYCLAKNESVMFDLSTLTPESAKQWRLSEEERRLLKDSGSVLCIPIKHKKVFKGCLYIEVSCKLKKAPFKRQTFKKTVEAGQKAIVALLFGE